MARLPIGEVVLFDYRIESLLDADGYGESYLASVPQTGERVVVRVPLEGASTEAQRRFAQEGALLSQLHHPNIAAFIQGGFLDDGTPAFAREFVDGSSLEELIDERGALPFWEALIFVLQLLDGLGSIHTHGAVHGAIAPEAIRIEAGTGIVKFVSFQRGAGHYNAPESARGIFEARSDLYAMGLLLYQLLAGEHLTDEDGRVLRSELLSSVVPAIPLPPSRPPIPAELARLVAELLEPDPVARPADVSTVVGVIEDVLELYAPKAAPDAPPTLRGSHFPHALGHDIDEKW